MHSRDSHEQHLSRLNRRPAPDAAALLGGKHPPKVREVDIAERTVTLADGAVLNLDRWMHGLGQAERSVPSGVEG